MESPGQLPSCPCKASAETCGCCESVVGGVKLQRPLKNVCTWTRSVMSNHISALCDTSRLLCQLVGAKAVGKRCCRGEILMAYTCTWVLLAGRTVWPRERSYIERFDCSPATVQRANSGMPLQVITGARSWKKMPLLLHLLDVLCENTETILHHCQFTSCPGVIPYVFMLRTKARALSVWLLL